MFYTDPLSVLLSIVVCGFLYIYFYGAKETSQKSPPGPKLILADCRDARLSGEIIVQVHYFKVLKMCSLQLSKKYGSVFSFRLGTQRTVVLCGYDTVKDALVNHADEFSERPRIPIAENLAKGYGIVFSHGENWKVMRRFALSTLRDFGMGKKILEEKINEECDCLVETFKSYKGEPFKNTTSLNAAFANIIVSILIGHRFDYQDPTLLKLLYLTNENFRIFGSPMIMVS
ncbi:hypothetical protein GDO86_018251 [Hymenochirus boettgeri]|uniref:Uncharacterized protein n=1 Tax=Hymenochirus boettgeri TaxID=247094 RepID=A0A8T2IBF2_9PIPI|nr:hypothetical protein GDO86_018251 [Hymenochirus boettgeri]